MWQGMNALQTTAVRRDGKRAEPLATSEPCKEWFGVLQRIRTSQRNVLRQVVRRQPSPSSRIVVAETRQEAIQPRHAPQYSVLRRSLEPRCGHLQELADPGTAPRIEAADEPLLV